MFTDFSEKPYSTKTILEVIDSGRLPDSKTLKYFTSEYNEFTKTYPKWEELLKDPVEGINQLVISKNERELRSLARQIDQNTYFGSYLLKFLGRENSTPATKKFIDFLIKNGNSMTLNSLALFTLPLHAEDYESQIKAIIRSGDVRAIYSLTERCLMNLGWQEATPKTSDRVKKLELLRYLVAMADVKILKNTRFSFDAFIDTRNDSALKILKKSLKLITPGKEKSISMRTLCYQKSAH